MGANFKEVPAVNRLSVTSRRLNLLAASTCAIKSCLPSMITCKISCSDGYAITNIIKNRTVVHLGFKCYRFKIVHGHLSCFIIQPINMGFFLKLMLGGIIL